VPTRNNWKLSTIVLAVALSILLILAVAPLGNTRRTEMDSFGFTFQLLSDVGGGCSGNHFIDPPFLCPGSGSVGNATIAFEWSTSPQRPVENLSLVAQTSTLNWVTLYDARNTSSGGFSFDWDRPACQTEVSFVGVSDQALSVSVMGWVVFNVTTQEPLL